MRANNQELVDAMLSGDESQAGEIADQFDGATAYISSKRAITQWMRRNSLLYVEQGVRMNSVEPGITQTPLTDAAFEEVSVAQAMKDFAESVPIGYIGKPAQIARAICFLLSPEADFACGSVLFVDGGHDAMLRPDQF